MTTYSLIGIDFSTLALVDSGEMRYTFSNTLRIPLQLQIVTEVKKCGLIKCNVRAKR